jgi:hypothetical protein
VNGDDLSVCVGQYLFGVGVQWSALAAAVDVDKHEHVYAVLRRWCEQRQCSVGTLNAMYNFYGLCTRALLADGDDDFERVNRIQQMALVKCFVMFMKQSSLIDAQYLRECLL